MTFQTWLTQGLDPSTIEWLAMSLLHFVWQAAAFGVVMIVARGALSRQPASTRYCSNLLCLLAMAACVPVNLMILSHDADLFGSIAVVADDGEARHGEDRSSGRAATTRIVQTSTVDVADEAEIPISHVPQIVTDTIVSAPRELSKRNSNRFARLAVALWSFGVVVMTLRLFISLFGSWRLTRSTARVVDAAFLAVVREQSRRVGLRMAPVVAWCERVSVPVVVGITRPIVLLPPALIAGLDLSQLRAILAHELAHIHRLDPLVNILQRVIESLLFFHPAIWFVSRRVSSERENCCDDIVVRTGVRPIEYASALVQMADLSANGLVPANGLAANGNGGSEFKRRIMRLLAPEAQVHAGSGLALMLLISGIFVVNAAVLLAKNGNQSDIGESPGRPGDLIAVLGEDRARFWGYPRELVLTSDEKHVFLAEEVGFVSAFDTSTLKRVLRFRAHKQRCLKIAMIDSATKLVTISTDGTVALWDVRSDKPKELDRLKVLTNYDGDVWMSFSASRNANRVAVRSVNTTDYNNGGDDSKKHSTVVLNVSGNRFVKQADLPQRADAAWHYAVSPDGNWLVTCEHTGEKEHISIDLPNGGRVGFVYPDSILTVWNLKSDPPSVVSESPRKAVEDLVFSPDGRLWANDPHYVKNLQSHSWALKEDKLVDHKSISIAPLSRPRGFSSDGRRSAIGSGQTLTVSSADGETRLATLATGGRTISTFLTNGSLITASAPLLQRWELDGNDYTKLTDPTGHQAPITGLVFDAHANSLLSLSGDSLREWRLADLSETRIVKLPGVTGKIGHIWNWPHRDGVVLSQMTEDGKTIHGLSRSGKDLSSQFIIDFEVDDVRCAATHPSEPVLATGHHDNHIRLWDISTPKPKQLVKWKAHRGRVCDITFSPDGKALASAGWDNQVILWEAQSWESTPSSRTIGQHKEIVCSVAFSNDSRFVVSGGEDRQILLWDRENPNATKSLSHPEDHSIQSTSSIPCTPNSLQFNSAGTRLLSGDRCGRVTVWSIPDCKIVKRWQLAGSIRHVRFTPDESMIATANGDGTVFLLRSPLDPTDGVQ